MDVALEALQKAVRVAGGQAALAKAIGVKPQHVWNWLNRDKRAASNKCAAIEAATQARGDTVSRHHLRADVFGPPPEAPPPNPAQAALALE
jgi:DNA-binding transcriptional regulator YdaS (Cro superfamily)